MINAKKILMTSSLLAMAFFFSSFYAEKEVPVVKWDRMEKLLNNTEDKIYIVNFWASWCRPCLEELPEFEAFQKKHKKENAEVILVNLDKKADLENKVIPMIKRKGIISTVWLLDETNFNSWIDKVDSSWSGAIPATLILNGASGKKIFHEGKYTQEQLESKIKQLK